ncbi:2-oxo acid dehydrogenase subunit E2 [Actinomadura spongiicola]|uniref:Dihydrolipoamide acetyltransferase component of pyruvate dehydrogenase complex n=1 Tax=Actinomadura spongiicola TaxID=2303421 RepID=A0A372GPS2_9ACTN|nr:dihydrolipoamide acetyltransferase family protein [Actinomadura spongiicola]RFS87391.1 2-oxo acid dehydrogenase subunit E2 [Actinomadura spongiicola]
MADLLRVPAVAAGATEIVLAEWTVAVGETFEAGDPLAVVETDKAAVEIEAETGATLLRTLAADGERLQVGAPLAVIGSPDDTDVESLLAALNPTEPTKSVEPTKTVESDSAGDVSDSPPPQVAAPPTGRPATAGRPLVSPIARRLLRDAGVSPSEVTGTGPGGRITRRDVETALAGRRAEATRPASSKPETPTVGAAYEVVPHGTTRRIIATRLTGSVRDVPHFYVRRTALVDELVTLRAGLNEHAPLRLSVNDLVLRAVAVAHSEVPEMNVVWAEEGMHRFGSVDIGVAMASDRGLVSPVLRSVEQRTVSSIAENVRNLARQADEGRLRPADLQGGSISVTNLGMYGVEEFAAIINPPQSAILAVGAARPTVRVVDGTPAPVTVMSLVLSADHRAVDGALAAQWMATLVRTIESPLRLLI